MSGRDHEVLEQRFVQVQKERDDLYSKFESSIYDVQQKSGLKNLMLERKLTTLTEQLEKKEAQLGEVLAASNLDQSTLQQARETKKKNWGSVLLWSFCREGSYNAPQLQRKMIVCLSSSPIVSRHCLGLWFVKRPRRLDGSSSIGEGWYQSSKQSTSCLVVRKL